MENPTQALFMCENVRCGVGGGGGGAVGCQQLRSVESMSWGASGSQYTRGFH